MRPKLSLLFLIPTLPLALVTWGCRCDRSDATPSRTPQALPSKAQIARAIGPDWSNEILSKDARKRSKGDTCSPTKMRSRCGDEDRSPRCEWVHWALTPAADVLARSGMTVEEFSAKLLSQSPRKLDGPTPAVPLDLIFLDSPHEPYQIPSPVNWGADPYHSQSWRRQFQDLSLVSKLSKKRDPKSLDAAAHLITDWAKHVLPKKSPPDRTWSDHPVASRATHAASFLRTYLEHHPSPNREAVVSALSIVMSHAFALAAPACYTRHHNHGLIQDKHLAALTRTVSLPSGELLSELAKTRALQDQLLHSLNKEGIQIENSTSYALEYGAWAADVARLFWVYEGKPVPDVLSQRLRLHLDNLPYFLQPGLRGPAFGDSRSDTLRGSVQKVLRKALPDTLSERTKAALTYLLEQGPPPDLARDWVEPKSGYATFRSEWSEKPADAVVIHFKASRLSRIHSHDDATSFTLYGYGTRWIVDAGRFGGKKEAPFGTYQYSAFAHNLLTADDASFRPRKSPRIVAHEANGTASWVEGAHFDYRHIGIEKVSRTLAYSRPGALLVSDTVQGKKEHQLTQHFHLGPEVNPPVQVAPSVIRATDQQGNNLWLLGENSSVRLVTGAETPTQGWYFPDLAKRVPIADIQFSRKSAPVEGKEHAPMRTLLILSRSNTRPRLLSAPGASVVRVSLAGMVFEFSEERGPVAK